MNDDGTSRRIAGRSSKIVSLARSLGQRGARVESRKFLAEGPQSVEYGLRVQQIADLLATESAIEQFPDIVSRAEELGVAVYVMDERTSRTIADTRTPQGIVGIANLPEQPAAEWRQGRHCFVVMLERAQDPGNVGTILRTADAAGADLVILGPGSADPYSPKAVRASAGSVFGIATLACDDPAAVIDVAKSNGLRTLATDATGEISVLDRSALPEFAEPVLWVFGNEASGLDANLVERCDRSVKVPIVGGAESLNVSAAAAVCLFSTTEARLLGYPNKRVV